MRLLKQAAMFAALMFLAVPALWPVAAFAQEVAASAIVVTEPTFLQELTTALLPVLTLIITTLVGIGLALLKQKTGIDIEARHREALQSALLNGVIYAIQKTGWLPGQSTEKLIGPARNYAEISVPDALVKFGLATWLPAGRARLDELILPHLPVPPGTVMPNGDVLVGSAT